MNSISFRTCVMLGISVLLVALISGCPGEGDPDPVNPSVPPTGDMSMTIGEPTKALTNKGPVSYKVTYTGAKAVTLSEGDVSLESTGTASGTVSVIGSGISSRTVTISNITGDGSLAIAIKEGTASDGKAKPAVAGKSKKVTVDNTPPTISISSPSTGDTSHGPVSYEITYGGADSITLTSSDIQLNVTGNDARDIKVTPSGPNTRTVTISDIGGNGTLGISIVAGTAKDDAGNMASAIGPSETFIVTNPGPSLAISAPSTDATNEGPVTYTITYSGADVISLSANDIVLNKTGTATGAVSVSTASATARTVTVSDIDGYYGDMGISVQSGTARDMVGNLAPSAGPSDTFEVYGPPPTLEPGNGFTEPTPQPDPIGEGPGADCNTIARWDVVPFQTFDGIFEIGVVAFHINGIDTVEFSLEGGPWTPAIPVMTLNPRTGVKEYWVKLDASLLPDGPCEIRAIAYPTVGIPLVLGEPIDTTVTREPDENLGWSSGKYGIVLVANKNGSYSHTPVYVSPNGSDTTGDGSESNPYATLNFAALVLKNSGRFNGGQIYLLEGTYTHTGFNTALNIDVDTWLNISSAPGVSRDQVIFYDFPGWTNMELLHLKGITFISPAGSTGTWFYGGLSTGSKCIWVDGCRIAGEVRTNRWTIVNQMSADFFTDILFENNVDGPSGLTLCREVHLKHIGADSFTQGRLVINCSVEDVDKHASGVPTAHADIYQMYDANDQLENLIVYGLTATEGIKSQGLFSTANIRDAAFVDMWIRQVPDTSNHCFTVGRASNMYVLRSKFEGASCKFGKDEYVQKQFNVVVEESRFGLVAPYLPTNWDLPGITFR